MFDMVWLWGTYRLEICWWTAKRSRWNWFFIYSYKSVNRPIVQTVLLWSASLLDCRAIRYGKGEGVVPFISILDEWWQPISFLAPQLFVRCVLCSAIPCWTSSGPWRSCLADGLTLVDNNVCTCRRLWFPKSASRLCIITDCRGLYCVSEGGIAFNTR
jgi:hypothetical protein